MCSSDLMFHHFHDTIKHITGQGSISAKEFRSILDYYAETYNIISADEFLYKSQNNLLSNVDVCLSFDDGLLCQYDVALPVLDEKGIKAFWFVYTSPIDGVLEKLEVYRHFRFSKFNDIEDFYRAFFRIAEDIDGTVSDRLKSFNPDEYAKECPFYTPNDKRFRYLRDRVLEGNAYDVIMNKMINEYGYDVAGNSGLLWLKAEHITNLYNAGHIIGLHSHTHPTVMIKKGVDGQLQEYSTNKERLESIIHDRIISVSYPCNSCNHDTFTIMRNLGIVIGFRATMANEVMEDIKLEYPREDHANILREIRSAENEYNSIHE